MASHEYKEVTPMLKLIVGTKGSGKTKTMIEMIDKATKAHHRDQPRSPLG